MRRQTGISLLQGEEYFGQYSYSERTCGGVLQENKKGWVIKLDLEKAYDRTEFLDQIWLGRVLDRSEKMDSKVFIIFAFHKHQKWNP